MEIDTTPISVIGVSVVLTYIVVTGMKVIIKLIRESLSR